MLGRFFRKRSRKKNCIAKLTKGEIKWGIFAQQKIEMNIFRKTQPRTYGDEIATGFRRMIRK